MTPSNTIEELVGRVEAATGPDRELDLLIAKAVGVVPADADWQESDDADLLPAFAKFLGKWETPRHRAALREWRQGLDAFFKSPEYRAGSDSYVRENPYPGTDEPPEAGTIAAYTSSTDAALALAERVLPGCSWAINGGAQVVPSATVWPASGAAVEADGHTSVLAIILATLKALSRIKGDHNDD